MSYNVDDVDMPGFPHSKKSSTDSYNNLSAIPSSKSMGNNNSNNNSRHNSNMDKNDVLLISVSSPEPLGEQYKKLANS